jgi:ankyrin repeat protein
MAAQNGRVELVRFLVSKGADVNARDWVRRRELG